MVGVGNQNAHLGCSNWFFCHAVAGERTGTTIQFPVTWVGRYTCLIGGNGVPEEMDVGTGRIGKVAKDLKIYNILPISDGDVGDLGA